MLIARGRGGLVTGRTIKRQRLQKEVVGRGCVSLAVNGGSNENRNEKQGEENRCKPRKDQGRIVSRAAGAKNTMGVFVRLPRRGVNEPIGKLTRYLRKQYCLPCVSLVSFP